MLKWKELEEFMVKDIDSKVRKMHILTGQTGADHISHLLFVHYLLDTVNDLLEQEKITAEEGTNLKRMLNSPDRDNVNIAEMIIKQFI